MLKFHHVDPCVIFKDYLLPQSTAMGSRNHQKKFQAPIYPEDPFSVGVPMPKYGQIRPKVNF